MKVLMCYCSVRSLQRFELPNFLFTKKNPGLKHNVKISISNVHVNVSECYASDLRNQTQKDQ